MAQVPPSGPSNDIDTALSESAPQPPIGGFGTVTVLSDESTSAFANGSSTPMCEALAAEAAFALATASSG
jgi:hypothetical protein